MRTRWRRGDGGIKVETAGGELLEEGEHRLEEGRRREEQRTGTQLR